MNSTKRAEPDGPLMWTTVVLLVSGVATVLDASFPRAGQSAVTGYNPYYWFWRQLLWAGLAYLALLGAMHFPFWRLRRHGMRLLLVAVALLVLVLIPGIGIEANGSRRWLGFGMFRFQPSEFAKLATVVFIAAYSDVWRHRIRDGQRGFLPVVLVLLVVGLLVAKEDLGTGGSVIATGLATIYVAGARPRHLALLFGPAVAGAVALILFEPYRIDRIRAWLDPFGHYDSAGYQPVQALLALANGGLFGVGIGMGRAKHLFLPAEHTDYIFATVAEELGLVGSLALLLAFAVIVIRGLIIAQRSRHWFGTVLAVGLTTMLGTQALLNLAVVSGLVPATGVPLPFVSYGGSSLVFTAVAVGLLLNISQYPNLRDRAERAPSEEEIEVRDRRRRHRRAHLSRA